MAVPGKKQVCPVCSDEVTEAEYRRELTCSFAACPGIEQAYHEECITKHLRRLRLPVDQLIGYACPVTLDNGKPCSGRISATHHRQPLNLKKKQKRVDAAAAAAAVSKPKPLGPKVKEAKPSVAAATAAMRPAGEGVLCQAGVSINAIKSVASSVSSGKATVKSVAPGSGPAARLNGTALAVSNNSAMMPKRVVRQHVIPGWGAPETTKGSASVPKVDRAKLAALKAEAMAGAGRSNKAQVVNTSAGPAASQLSKETGSMRFRQVQQHGVDSDGGSEDLDAHFFMDTFPCMRQAGVCSDLEGEGSVTPPEKPQDFSLAPEDFPAFPVSAAASTRMASNVPIDAPAASSAKRHADMEPISSGGSSFKGTPPASTPATTEDEVAVDGFPPEFPESPAAICGDESDPIVVYDQIYETVDGLVVVQDVHGNFYEMKDVYGPNAEVYSFDDGVNPPTYFVGVRQSALLKAQQETVPTPGICAEGFGAAAAMTQEPAAHVAAPVMPGPDTKSTVNYPLPSGFEIGAGGVEDYAGAAVTSDGGQPYGPMAVEQGDGAGGINEQSADLEDLLALCLVSTPASAYKSPMPQSQSSKPAAPVASFHADIYSKMGYETVDGAGYVADAPAGTSDEAEEVDSLMQLLCV